MNVKLSSRSATVNKVISDLQGVADRTKEIRDEIKQRKTPEAVERIWRDALHDYFPKSPRFAWTRKQLGQAKKFLLKLRHDADLNDFFRVIILNWTRIMAAHFPWIEKPPIYPDIGLVLAYPAPFWEAYSGLSRDGFTPRPKSSSPFHGAPTGDLAALKKQNAKLAAMLDAQNREIGQMRRKLRGIKPVKSRKTVARGQGLKEWLD